MRVRQSGSADINLDEIDTHLNQLWNFDQPTSYSKQKDSLQKEWENFLLGLPGKPSLVIVSPSCVVSLCLRIEVATLRCIKMVVPFRATWYSFMRMPRETFIQDC